MRLSSFPVWVDVMLFTLGTVIAVIAVYALSRVLFARYTDAKTETLASSVIFRIAALHSLILALVFAQEQINYSNLRASIVTEADAVADVYYDLVRYDEAATEAIRAHVRDYLIEAAGPEWQLLSEGKLSAKAWTSWEAMYQGVLNLEPATPRQTWLHNNMLHDIDTISDTRTNRELAAVGTVTDLFWIAAIVGLLLVVAPYFTFPPTALNLVLLTIFATFNGLVLFFIAALANPYSQPEALQPLPFARLLVAFTQP